MCLFGTASVWGPTGMLGQVAIIFKAFLLVDLCLGTSTLQLIVFSPHSPLEVESEIFSRGHGSRG